MALPWAMLAPMIAAMKRSIFLVILAASVAAAQSSSLKDQVESVFPDAKSLYLDLHQHPELSSHETRTSALLADKLRALGYQVTASVGGTGGGAIMKNGARPTG